MRICEGFQTVGKGSVLVVDDDRFILSAFTRILRKRGINTYSAKSAEEALARLDGDSYDIALVDLRIPEVDEAQLLKKMSKKDHDMIKILITDFPAELHRRSAMEKDAIVYVKKPVKPERLLKLISRELQSKIARMQS